jgi:hypothetical protein
LLTGRSFAGLVSNPSAIAPRAQDGILYHWTSFAYLNHGTLERFREARKKKGISRAIDMSTMLRENTYKRGLMRGASNGRYKFARYFNAHEHDRPQTWEDLIKVNDLELYDLEKDIGETDNLAATPEAVKDVLIAMNALTNALAAKEIGRDDGRHMPIFAR